MCSWNNIIFNGIFSTSEASTICRLPPSCTWFKWYLGLTSLYIAASVARNWNIIRKQQVFRRIWSLLCRLPNSCLPICTRLIQKVLIIDDTCVHCDLSNKSNIHSFFLCPKAISCWELVRLDSTVCDLLCTADNFITLLFDFFYMIQNQQQETTSMIL